MFGLSHWVLEVESLDTGGRVIGQRGLSCWTVEVELLDAINSHEGKRSISYSFLKPQFQKAL